MGLIDWLKGKFSRDKPQNSYRFSGYPFLFGQSISNQTVNEQTAMQNSAIAACVKIIAESVASLPLHVYEYTKSGKEKAMKHPLFFLLHDAPNEEMTSFIWREVTLTHLLLWGNSYSQIQKNNNGKIIGLYPLLPSKMTVERNDAGVIQYRYQRYTDEELTPKEKGEIIMPREDILHIAGLGFNGLIGYSPIAMAKNAIGLSMATERYGSKFFAGGARPQGILKMPTAIKDFTKIQESWQSMYTGENEGKIPVLEQGMEYQSISIPPQDAQFLATRRFQLEEIARIFRVPLAFLNDLEHATYSNVEQQSLNFVVYSLMPWITRLEQAMNKSLLSITERGKFFVKFNVGGLLRGDMKSRYESYAIGRNNGFLSANDVRELEDLNKISAEDGGDFYLVNGNMTKLSDAGLFGKKNDGYDTVNKNKN